MKWEFEENKGITRKQRRLLYFIQKYGNEEIKIEDYENDLSKFNELVDKKLDEAKFNYHHQCGVGNDFTENYLNNGNGDF